jgi:16S rRNA (guanine527-N7)-methyltransferase
MEPEAVRMLRTGAARWGLALDNGQIDLFGRFLEGLIAAAARTNLTAIREPLEIVSKHFLDSLAGSRVLGRVTPGSRLIDVGSGAGFPGLPLKIACPGLEITLLEASGRKAAFLRDMVARLGLAGVRVVHARAEEAGRDPEHRERYGFAVARAVAEVRVLVEYCLPFLCVGGLFIAYKGPDIYPELERAERALAALGGVVREVEEFRLPEAEAGRSLVVIEKRAPTPARFPRRPGMAAKRPF